MSYIDGFVLPVPEQNLKLYRNIAQKAGKIFKEYGALHYVEAVGDDLNLPFGVPFPKAFKIYKSRADRDRVNAKVMSDPRMQKMMEDAPCPFDAKRMVVGGFKSLIDM